MNTYTKKEYLLLADILYERIKNEAMVSLLLNIIPLIKIIRNKDDFNSYTKAVHIKDLPGKIEDDLYKGHQQPKLKYDAIYNLSIEKIVLLLNDKDPVIKAIAAWRILIGR